MTRCLLAAVLSLGCLSVPHRQTLPGLYAVAPPSPARVAECQAIADRHDAWSTTATIAGAVSGGAGGVGGLLAGNTRTVDNERLGLGIGAGVMGVLAAVGTAVASVESSAFAAHGCGAVLAGAPVVTQFEARYDAGSTSLPVATVPPCVRTVGSGSRILRRPVGGGVSQHRRGAATIFLVRPRRHREPMAGQPSVRARPDSFCHAEGRPSIRSHGACGWVSLRRGYRRGVPSSRVLGH